MELRPILTVNSTKPLSFAQAYKALKKFQTDHSADSSVFTLVKKEEKKAQLSDDSIVKLNIIIDELKNLSERGLKPSKSATVDMFTEDTEIKSNKKRKREKELNTSDGEVKKEHKKHKKHKKSSSQNE
jgi:hypothetical protein